MEKIRKKLKKFLNKRTMWKIFSFFGFGESMSPHPQKPPGLDRVRVHEVVKRIADMRRRADAIGAAIDGNVTAIAAAASASSDRRRRGADRPCP